MNNSSKCNDKNFKSDNQSLEEKQNLTKENAEALAQKAEKDFINQNYLNAFNNAKKAIELDENNSLALYLIGNCYYFGYGIEKNYKKDAKWYKKAAEQGHSDAQKNLGNCYYYGHGIEKNYNTAFLWYKKAA